jgi:hypothetical protein
MPLSALMRKVELINLDKQTKDLTIVDGLSQMLPAGIDYGGYKAISNLLQSWMEVEEADNHVFLKLRASTADSSEVKAVEEGNFYAYFGLNKFKYLYDYKAVFAQDSAFNTPYQLINHDFEAMSQQTQAPVNQVPSAFVVASISLKDQQTFYGLFGYIQQRPQLNQLLKTMNARIESMMVKTKELAKALEGDHSHEDIEFAHHIAHKLLPLSEQIAEDIAYLEENISEELWPLPTYFDMLFIK